MAKRAMISQPMAGKTDREIGAERIRVMKILEEMGYEVLNTFFTEEDVEEAEHVALSFLGKSIEAMSHCDAVFFCPGWWNARGCRIEHEIALAYGLEILTEGGEAE